MTTIEAVFGQIEDAQAEAAAATARIERRLEHNRKTLGTWDNKHLAEERARDYAADAEREKAQVDRDLTRRLVLLRREGREAIEAERQTIMDAAFLAAIQQGPQGAEAWQEAEARAPFVREDMAATTDPSEIVRRYELLKDAGDHVGAWLVARYGRRALVDGLEQHEPMSAASIAWHRALDALDKSTRGELEAEQQKALSALSGLATKLAQPRTDGDLAEIAGRYGVRLYD